MADTHQVNITELKSISKELVSKFFPTHDMYSLLVLSLVTITEYSRKKHKLTTKARIDVSIMFIDDLIQTLIDINVINLAVADKLLKDCQYNKNSLPLILQAYIYAAIGLKANAVNIEKEHTGCFW